MILLAVLAVAICSFFGIKRARDLKAYAGMALECHPVWQDLAVGRVYKGQQVNEVIETTQPVYVIRHGRFVEIGYQEPFAFTVIQIVAMDGKVVQACAASCTWDYLFFDSMSDDEQLEMSDSFDTNERTMEYNGRDAP
jgi:hypothetical protein